MAITHVEGLAAHLDLYRSAVAFAYVHVSHCHYLESGDQEAKHFGSGNLKTRNPGESELGKQERRKFYCSSFREFLS
jgi:hypothetical protein